MDSHLSVKQVAKWLGVGQSTVYGWVNENKIPFIKLPGSVVRFKAAELERWIKERTVHAKPIGQ